jgi:putative zinc finger protein
VTRELSCRELVELVTDYFEDALSRRDRKRFDRHISGCDGCTAYLEQMRGTIRATGMLTEEQVPEEARGELLGAFRGWKASGA